MNTGIVLAIDPGQLQSGFVFLHGDFEPMRSGIESNERVLEMIAGSNVDTLAIEMIASYGMPVGKETFETCLWIGRFVQTWKQARGDSPVSLIYRKDVKMHLCNSPRAKDAHIRQRLLDIFGPTGTKKNPGKLYGVKSHAWAALAVALTAQQVPHVAQAA